jgi:PAS domain S-box-containing protein
MLEKLRTYLKPPVFPGDEDKTFTAGLLHVVLWSLLVGVSLYTLTNSIFAIIQPHMLSIAWLYVIAIGTLTVTLMVVMRRGYVRFTAIGVNVGFWLILSVAAYFNGGVAAPAYSGYLIVIISTCLLVTWQWGLAAAIASTLAGLFFLRTPLPDWLPTYSFQAVWSANVAYFFIVTMLVALALRAIKRAAQQTRDAVIERQKTEQALSHSEQRFRAIFDAVNDAIFVQDLNDGRILDVNQTMCEMYGCTLEEARQSTIEDLSAGRPPYTQQDAIGWTQRAAGGEPQVFEWHAKDYTGRLFWVEVNMRRAAIDGQDRLLVVVRDIDERKRAEETLRHEQVVTRQIAEAALMTPTLEEFYQAIYATVKALVPASNFYIALYDAARDQFSVPYLIDEFDQEWAPYSPGNGLNAYLLRTGEPLLVTPEVWPELEQQGDVEILNRRMVEWLGVPLKTPQGLLGVMAVQNYSGPARLNEKHKDLLVFVSAQVAMTIERKRAEERERRFTQGLRAVIEAAQELIEYTDLDTLHRRSVELTREKLGLERCALYLLEDDGQFIRGTFGTDSAGQTTDERPARDTIAAHPEVLSLSDRLWTSYESNFRYWRDGTDQLLGSKGWNVATLIRSRRRTVGVLYNDAAITHAPLDETQQDLTAVYASLLGSLLELKRTEAELAHERDLLQALMDYFPDTIYFKDLASRFTRINRAQAKLLRVATPAEAIGKTDADFFQTSGLAQSFLAEEQQLMTSGKPIFDRAEYNPTADGQPRWLSATKVPLRDTAGQIVGMVGISRDITDRMRAEQREKTISQGLRAAIEAAQELIDCPDLDTLYRRSVELAREKLGVERCGLYLLDDQAESLLGTYGTDDQGRTIDERAAREMISPVQHDELFAQLDRLWSFREGPLTYWQTDATKVMLQQGWNAATPIRSRRRTVGVLYNDAAITHALLDEARQDVVAVYCSLLGSLIELKRTEDQLAHERDLLQSLMDNIPDAIYFKDTASRFTNINQAMGRILGVSDLRAALGKTDADFFPAGLDAMYLAEEQQLVHTGQPLLDRVEYNRTADGQPRWFSATKVPLHDVTGKITGLVGISRDITDRRLMEERLRESQARFGSAFEFAAVGMALVARDHRIVQVNQAFCRMLGYSPDEVVGRVFGDLTHPDDVALSANYHRRLFAGEVETYQFEKRYLHRDGRAIWAWLTVSVVRDAEQRPQYAIAQIQDITERKQAEEREQRTSRGLRAVIETVDELMGCADLDALYRQAVELARAKLKVERCGLFVLDEQGWLRGAYGTDMRRQTTDERGARFSPVNVADFDAAASELWVVNEAQQTYWNEQQQEIVGIGWIASTFIRARDRVMGVLYNDTAITHTPVDEAQQEVLAVYCSVLGSLIELKYAEEAVHESEALYRRAIEAAGAVPYYLDYATESYRSMGDGIQAMTGLPPGEMQPLAWDGLILESYPLGQTRGLSRSEAVHEARIGHVAEWRCDYRIRRRDGSERWITDASIPVLDEQGQPRGAIGILQDITARKQVELALRESEATTRALLEAIPDEFFRFGANGVFKEYIPSKDFAPLMSPADFIGQAYAAVLPPVIVEQLDLNFRQVLERGELRTYEYPLLSGDETRYFEARLVKMTQGDVLGMVRDVTDRKRAELALQQREAYLRSMLDNFPYLVWLKDVDGRFLAANQIFAEACGQPDIDAVIGKTDLDVWPREMAERYRADDRRVMDSGQKQSVEEIISEHDGDIWFETFKSPIFDAQGRVLGTAGFSHDVTARRQAEAAMRESEALFRQLADNAPAFIALSDENGTATYLNRVWREFRGNEPALPLKDWAERIHPDDRRRYLSEFQTALQGQRKLTMEYRLRRADGQYRWLLDTVVPRYAADERFAGFIGIAIDITDRKNAEEALRRSEGRLRMITDNMADSISQLDARQRLIYVSPSAERVYGHSLRDLLGHSLYDFVHPEDGRRLYHQVVMGTELQVPALRLEYRFRHAAGHYLWAESEMRLLYDDLGNFSGAVLGSRDVSARKQIEAEREALIAELEDKNAELERFTYTVSHDLKSPLITIRGFLGFLEKDAASGNLDRLRADIARIAEATTRMQRLLDELLELSRIGRMSNPLQEVAFEQIAREAVELVQGRIMARGVQVEIADDLPVVYADRTRLVEAVQNLVDNAVKFTGDQPEPRIVIGVLDAQRAGMPVLFVTDNGLGIAPEYHDRIFGLFNKLDAKTDGTGVGLALVKRIIDLHGGQIWVESDGAGRGSTFFFTLPRPAAPKQSN